MNAHKKISLIVLCLQMIACLIQISFSLNEDRIGKNNAEILQPGLASLDRNNADFQTKPTPPAKKNLEHESILSPLPPLPVQTILPKFQLISLYLQRNTNVPIILPTKVLDFDGRTLDRFHAYVNPSSLSSSRYEISLDVMFPCRGSEVGCDRGYISGEKITPNTRSLSVMYADHLDYIRGVAIAKGMKHLPDEGGLISLARGIEGYYFPAICGANCHVQSIVAWEQNGYQYKIGIKIGRRDAMIEMANSAIENQL